MTVETDDERLVILDEKRPGSKAVDPAYQVAVAFCMSMS
jgi:hypothetical protein